MHDRDVAMLCAFPKDLNVLVAAQARRQLSDDVLQRLSQRLFFLRAARVEAGLARILDVFGTLEHAVEIARHLASCAEQTDLNDDRAHLPALAEHVPHRRIGYAPAVPVRNAV